MTRTVTTRYPAANSRGMVQTLRRSAPCHPERSEGSAFALLPMKQIPRCARDAIRDSSLSLAATRASTSPP